jgi:hypothetical protein
MIVPSTFRSSEWSLPFRLSEQRSSLEKLTVTQLVEKFLAYYGRVHKSPPRIPILGHINPVNTSFYFS